MCRSILRGARQADLREVLPISFESARNSTQGTILYPGIKKPPAALETSAGDIPAASYTLKHTLARRENENGEVPFAQHDSVRKCARRAVFSRNARKLFVGKIFSDKR